MKVGYQTLADLQQQWAFKQWGYIESLSGTRDLNLPLAYVNRHLCVVATGGNTKGYGAIRAQTISLTQVRLYAYTSEDGAYSHYLSLGYQLQWGKYTNSGNDRVITYPIAFSELYYANVISSDNCETFVYGISNTNINYRLCNGYNDDRWNGTQTSRLFAVGR